MRRNGNSRESDAVGGPAADYNWGARFIGPDGNMRPGGTPGRRTSRQSVLPTPAVARIFGALGSPSGRAAPSPFAPFEIPLSAAP